MGDYGGAGRAPVNPPDFEAENRALTALAQDMTAEPRAVLQKCAELAVLLRETVDAEAEVQQLQRLDAIGQITPGVARF